MNFSVANVLLAVKIGFAESMGFVILLPACVLHKWTDATVPSSKPIVVDTRRGTFYRPTVDQWSWSWLNAWYANVEDGVSGQQAWVWDANGHQVPYPSLYPAWVPKWVIAYGWSAWRNGANNIKRPLR